MEKSKFQFLIECNDDIKHIGYDFRGNLFKNSISSYIFYNEKIQPMILKFEDMMKYMIEQAKYIKQHYNYAIRKDNYKFN